MTSTLIICVPDPKNTPFKSLKVCYRDKRILSIHYLPKLEKTTSPLNGFPKNIADALCGYLDNPSPACFAALRTTLRPCYDNISPSQQKVSVAIQKIPYGETSAYSSIARNPRYVGTVCKTNPFAIVVPCFRVIRADNTLGGFKGNPHVPKDETSLEIKAWLLEHEKGVEVIRDSGKSADRWKVRCKSS